MGRDPEEKRKSGLACGVHKSVAGDMAPGSATSDTWLEAMRLAKKNAEENAVKAAMKTLPGHACEKPCEQWHKIRIDLGRIVEVTPEADTPSDWYTVSYVVKWILDIKCSCE